MIRKNNEKQSNKERLEEITQLLNEEKQKYPLDFTARTANLLRRIQRIKKSMGTLTEDEQDRLVRSMIDYAFHMKTAEYKDRYAAKNTFEQILKIDPRNAEANYRYAFLHYEDRNWIKAITYFNRALQDNDSAFPLCPDQVIKAHLFIGYCSVELAKASMQVADGLSGESEVASSTGISIEELSMKLQERLVRTEFVLYSNEGRKMISKREYETLKDNLESHELLLDFSEHPVFAWQGDASCEIPMYNAVVLKQLLVKSVENAALSLSELDGYQEESVANSHEVTWGNYRQKIRRLNLKLVEIGFPEKLIKNVPDKNSYQVQDIHFYIITRDGQ